MSGDGVGRESEGGLGRRNWALQCDGMMEGCTTEEGLVAKGLFERDR